MLQWERKADIVVGTILRNRGGITMTRDVPEAVTVGGKHIFISGSTFKIDMTKAPKGSSSRVDRYGQGTSLDTMGASADTVTQAEPDVKERQKSQPGKTKKASPASTKLQGFSPSTAGTISIVKFLEIVKGTHQSILTNAPEHPYELFPVKGEETT